MLFPLNFYKNLSKKANFISVTYTISSKSVTLVTVLSLFSCWQNSYARGCSFSILSSYWWVKQFHFKFTHHAVYSLYTQNYSSMYTRQYNLLKSTYSWLPNEFRGTLNIFLIILQPLCSYSIPYVYLLCSNSSCR